MPEFTIGDTVTTTSGTRGEIAFGPYKRTSVEPDMYLIQREDGTALPVLAADIIPHPDFAVGETAVTAGGIAATVEAGPFTMVGGTTFYVLRNSDNGACFVTTPRRMTRMTVTASPASTYVLDGTTYNLGARYTDRDGDVWRFVDDAGSGEMPLMTLDVGRRISKYSLKYVVDHYGPLTLPV